MTRKNKCTLNRFFALLRRTRDWHLTGAGFIRKEARFRDSPSYPIEYCPLTGACRLATRKIIDSCFDDVAARLLGLHPSTAICLSAAADGETNTRTKRAYRRQLLETTGLAEGS